jgi:hypothetical protein
LVESEVYFVSTFTAPSHPMNSALTSILYKNELLDPVTGMTIMGVPVQVYTSFHSQRTTSVSSELL